MSDYKINVSEKLVLYRSKVVLFGALLFSLVYGGMALSYLVEGDHRLSEQWPGLSLAFMLVVIAVIVIGWSLSHLILNRPLIVIDKDGIYSSKVGKIYWQEVENVSVSLYRHSVPTISPTIILNLTKGQIVRLSLQLSRVKGENLNQILKAYRGIV